MKKVLTMILMLCLILSGAFCFANGETRTENEEGLPIEVIRKMTNGLGGDRGSAISLILSGHRLTAVFSENLGQVSVLISK